MSHDWASASVLSYGYGTWKRIAWDAGRPLLGVRRNAETNHGFRQ